MFDSFMQTLEDPHARHAAFVHLPIVMCLLAPVVAIALAVTRFRHRPTALVLVAVLLAASLGAGLASGAGEEAYERVEDATPPLTMLEHDALEEHEALGEGGWMWPAGAAAIAALTLVPVPRIRLVAGGLTVAACLGVAGWASLAGHTGGQLVYEHGLGVPARQTPAGDQPPPARENRDD